jgi:hypothetical protein
MYNVKKKTCLGSLNRGERDNDNKTSLKEREGIEMSTTVLPFTITIITTSIVTQ